MLSTFSSVAPFIKLNPQGATIDNIVFKLHYRWTFVSLIVATILVCSRQYVGEHIKCISDAIPANVINTYCFFTTTFTVVRYLNNTALSSGTIFQPGIGPYLLEEEPIKRHAYYQWVPFVLFGQALCFYLPHLLWKSWEGGRIKALVFGFKMVGLTKCIKKESYAIGDLSVPSISDVRLRVHKMRRTMIDHMRLNQSWGAHLVLAEILNLFNILLQIYWTNLFLDGAFYGLGIKVLRENWTEQMDVLDIVFPKVTKCNFHKFGASGSLQMHDTLCVMALNIINEKIFTILWFWYLFVLVSTILGLISRVFSLLFFKSFKFTRCCFYWAKPGKLNEKELSAVIEKCNFSNWMFLFFLRTNLSEWLFNMVIFHLASEFPKEKINGSSDDSLDKEKQTPYPINPSQFDTMKIDEIDMSLIKKDSNKTE